MAVLTDKEYVLYLETYALVSTDRQPTIEAGPDVRRKYLVALATGHAKVGQLPVGKVELQLAVNEAEDV